MNSCKSKSSHGTSITVRWRKLKVVALVLLAGCLVRQNGQVVAYLYAYVCTCRESGQEVALRNEEYNRQRLQRGGGSSGGLRVTDPRAFQRLMEDMRKKSEEQAKLEHEREEERRKREGSAYKTKEERAREAREAKERAQEEGDARALDDDKFDPKKDYYGVLGLDRAASASEVRAAYRKFSLLYHPDKHKASSEEERKAIAQKFLDVAKAFDVLTNEDRRAVYDKCRDYMETNPGKGLPTLTPEESRQVSRGAGELSRMRRMGPKLKKHDTLHKKVTLELEKLNFGCTESVTVSRRRVDYSGKEFVSEKTFHLVIRKGSREGDTLVYEDEGEESVDTHAGDLVFTLYSKPHPVFKRVGDKDLEVFVHTKGNPDDLMQLVDVKTLSDKDYTLCLHSLYESLANKGCGGMWTCSLPGQGLFDPKSPWNAPVGILNVSARYPAFLVEEKSINCCVKPGEVYLLGSAEDVVPARIVASLLLDTLKHRIEAFSMRHDYQLSRKGNIVIIQIQSSDHTSRTDTAVSAMKKVFEQQHITVRKFDTSADSCTLDDSFWCISDPIDLIVVDFPILSGHDDHQARSTMYKECRKHMDSNGILQILWQEYMRGSDIVAIEGAVELLGRSDVSETPAILPMYSIRPGGGKFGFDDVCLSLMDDNQENQTCVGILEGSVYTVDTRTGEAEMLMAPYKEALIKKATWDCPVACSGNVDEADDDFGYMTAFTRV